MHACASAGVGRKLSAVERGSQLLCRVVTIGLHRPCLGWLEVLPRPGRRISHGTKHRIYRNINYF